MHYSLVSSSSLFGCVLVVAATIGALVIGDSQQVAAVQSTYEIKARRVESVTEALSYIRRFLPDSMPLPEKCERYGVLLDKMSDSFVDQFLIAEIGLAPKAEIRKKLGLIDRHTLRQVYTDAIDKFLESRLDLAMLDLVECLSSKFRSIDTKALAYLRNQTLKDTVDQYRSIMEQPLQFFLHSNTKHPTLTRAELKPAIKRTLLALFNGRAKEIDARFSEPSGSERLIAPASEVAPEVSPTSSSSSDEFPASNITPAVELASETNSETSSADLNDILSTLGKQSEAGDIESSAEEPGAHELPDPAQQLAPIPVDTSAREGEGTVEPSAVGAPELVAEPDEQAADDELTGEELEYLDNVIYLLHRLYYSMPLDTLPDDRCLAYSRIMATDMRALNESLVVRLVQEIDTKKRLVKMSTRIGRLGSKSPAVPVAVFEPDETTRQDFLFVLVAFGPDELGDETWIDLVDCIFELDDPNVRKFINSRQTRAIMRRIMSTPRGVNYDESDSDDHEGDHDDHETDPDDHDESEAEMGPAPSRRPPARYENHEDHEDYEDDLSGSGSDSETWRRQPGRPSSPTKHRPARSRSRPRRT